MKRRSLPDPDQPLGPPADLAAKVRAQYIEAVDPALQERHLGAMTQAFRKAEATRPVIVAGHWRRTMTTGFLASTAAKVAAVFFAALIATGSALAATGNLDVVQEVLPGAEEAAEESDDEAEPEGEVDDDLSEPGNEDEVTDVDEAEGTGGEAADETGDADGDEPGAAEDEGAEGEDEGADAEEADDCEGADAEAEDPAEEVGDEPEDVAEGEDCTTVPVGGEPIDEGAEEAGDEEVE